MRCCPKCQQPAAPGLLFCQKCGTRVPDEYPQRRERRHSGASKGLLVGAWVSLVANILIFVVLLCCIFSVWSTASQMEELGRRLAEMKLDQDSFLPSGTDPEPTDPIPTDPVRPEVDATQAPTPGPTEPTGEAVRSISIRVWTPYEDQLQAGWLETMEWEFEKEHPEYAISWINEPMPYDSVVQQVQDSPSTAADVFLFSCDYLDGLVEQGGLTRLSGAYRDQVRDDNCDFMEQTVTAEDGGLYAFPVEGNTWFLYYNKDLLTEQDVKDLDTMLAKQKVCIPFEVPWCAGSLFLGTGGTVFGPDGRDASAGVQFGGAAGYAAGKKMVELAAHPNYVGGGLDVYRLEEREVAAVFSGSWDADMLRDSLGDKLGAAQLPTFQAGGKTYRMKAMSTAWCVGINPNSRKVDGKEELCTQFAAFLASQEGQLLRYEMRGVIPGAEALLNDPQIRQDEVAVAQLETLRYNAVIQPVLPQMENFWDPMEDFGQGCSNGTVTMEDHQAMVDLMMDQMNEDCSTAYAGYYTVITETWDLSIRGGHGTTFPILGSIPKGTRVYVSKASGSGDDDWAHVTYDGISGYCSMQYLEKD